MAPNCIFTWFLNIFSTTYQNLDFVGHLVSRRPKFDPHLNLYFNFGQSYLKEFCFLCLVICLVKLSIIESRIINLVGVVSRHVIEPILLGPHLRLNFHGGPYSKIKFLIQIRASLQLMHWIEKSIVAIISLRVMYTSIMGEHIKRKIKVRE